MQEAKSDHKKQTFFANIVIVICRDLETHHANF